MRRRPQQAAACRRAALFVLVACAFACAAAGRAPEGAPLPATDGAAASPAPETVQQQQPKPARQQNMKQQKAAAAAAEAPKQAEATPAEAPKPPAEAAAQAVAKKQKAAKPAEATKQSAEATPAEAPKQQPAEAPAQAAPKQQQQKRQQKQQATVAAAKPALGPILSAPFSGGEELPTGPLVCDGQLRAAGVVRGPFPADFPHTPISVLPQFACSRPRGGGDPEDNGACGAAQGYTCGAHSFAPVVFGSGQTPGVISPKNPVVYRLSDAADPDAHLTYVEWTAVDVGTAGARLRGVYPEGSALPPVTADHEWAWNGPAPATGEFGPCSDCSVGRGIKTLAVAAAPGAGFRGMQLSQLHVNTQCAGGDSGLNYDGIYWHGLKYRCARPTCGDADLGQPGAQPYACPSGRWAYDPSKANATAVSPEGCCVPVTCADTNPLGQPGKAFKCPEGTEFDDSKRDARGPAVGTCCAPRTCADTKPVTAPGTPFACPGGREFDPARGASNKLTASACCSKPATCADTLPISAPNTPFECPADAERRPAAADATILDVDVCCARRTCSNRSPITDPGRAVTCPPGSTIGRGREGQSPPEVGACCVNVVDAYVTKAVSPPSSEPRLVGATSTFTLTVGARPDSGTALPAQNVTLTDVLPAGLALISMVEVDTPAAASGSKPACAATKAGLACFWPELAAGATRTVTLTANHTLAGEWTNTATVTTDSADADLSDNAASVAVKALGACCYAANDRAACRPSLPADCPPPAAFSQDRTCAQPCSLVPSRLGPPPTGACCLADGSGCQANVPRRQCMGEWSQGAACSSDGSCPAPPSAGVARGACCVNGWCADGLAEDNCAGAWTGNATCADAKCGAATKPKTGACCGADGQCVSGTEKTQCVGSWAEGRACSPGVCATARAVGACCSEGACAEGRTAEQCAGGLWARGQRCDDIVCRAVELGSCCDPRSGACTSNVAEEACPQGGSWLKGGECGKHGFCVGACCDRAAGGSSGCSQKIREECGAGSPWELYEPCRPFTCPAPRRPPPPQQPPPPGREAPERPPQPPQPPNREEPPHRSEPPPGKEEQPPPPPHRSDPPPHRSPPDHSKGKDDDKPPPKDKGDKDKEGPGGRGGKKDKDDDDDSYGPPPKDDGGGKDGRGGKKGGEGDGNKGKDGGDAGGDSYGPPAKDGGGKDGGKDGSGSGRKGDKDDDSSGHNSWFSFARLSRLLGLGGGGSNGSGGSSATSSKSGGSKIDGVSGDGVSDNRSRQPGGTATIDGSGSAGNASASTATPSLDLSDSDECLPRWQACHPGGGSSSKGKGGSAAALAALAAPCCAGSKCGRANDGDRYACKPSGACEPPGKRCGGDHSGECCKGLTCVWNNAGDFGVCRRVDSCKAGGARCNSDSDCCGADRCKAGGVCAAPDCDRKCRTYECFVERQKDCTALAAAAASNQRVPPQ